MQYNLTLLGLPARADQINLTDASTRQVESSHFFAWFPGRRHVLHTRLDASFGPVSQSDAPILARLAHDIEFDLGTLGTLQIRRLDLPSRLQRGDLAELAKKPMEDLFIHLPRHAFPLNAVRGPYRFGLGDMTFEQCANLVGGPAQAAIRRSYAELTEKQFEA